MGLQSANWDSRRSKPYIPSDPGGGSRGALFSASIVSYTADELPEHNNDDDDDDERIISVMASYDKLFFKPTRVPPTSVDSEAVKLSFPAHAKPDGEGDEQTHGLIAVVTLDRPEVLNAVTRDEITLLIATLQWIGEQDQILVVVLTGKGRFFSAGANFNQSARSVNKPAILDELDRKDPRHVLERRKYNLQMIATTQSMLCRTLVNLDKLVVGALNGPAIGICAVMVSYFDLIYTHEDFWLATPFSSLALVAEGGSSLSFSRKVCTLLQTEDLRTEQALMLLHHHRWEWEEHSRHF